MRLAQMILTVMLVATTGMDAALAQDGRLDGRLQFSSTAFGLLFGYSQGQGSLEFKGKNYPFTISGVKAATVGVSKVDALGQVYRLREIADFPGTYVAIEGGFTLFQGGGSAMLRNEKGVTLYLQNVQYGLDLTLGGGGLSIALSEPATTSSPTTQPSGQ
ncbi:MAG: hypothetical protein ACOYMW_06625 [Candidatus Competibacteraceae bacterium]